VNEAMVARFRKDGSGGGPALFLAAFFVLFPPALEASAADAPPSLAGERVDILAGDAFSATQPMLFGVRMTMREGWHTYWRKPGDSGIAPRFDWSASGNVAEVKLLWPAPERFDAEGDMTVGYEREVIWPVLVRAADPKKPVTLDMKMSYGVCSDICVPGEAHRTYRLSPVTADSTAAFARDGEPIRAFLARVPTEPKEHGDVSATLDGATLHATLKGVRETPALIVEGPRGVWFGKPRATRNGETLDYAVPVEIEGDAALKGREVTLTFSGPATAIEATRKLE
jgi:DsbC/DsbD-like thiol-disulfide interchange protein